MTYTRVRRIHWQEERKPISIRHQGRAARSECSQNDSNTANAQIADADNLNKTHLYFMNHKTLES